MSKSWSTSSSTIPPGPLHDVAKSLVAGEEVEGWVVWHGRAPEFQRYLMVLLPFFTVAFPLLILGGAGGLSILLGVVSGDLSSAIVLLFSGVLVAAPLAVIFPLIMTLQSAFFYWRVRDYEKRPGGYCVALGPEGLFFVMSALFGDRVSFRPWSEVGEARIRSFQTTERMLSFGTGWIVPTITDTAAVSLPWLAQVLRRGANTEHTVSSVLQLIGPSNQTPEVVTGETQSVLELDEQISKHEPPAGVMSWHWNRSAKELLRVVIPGFLFLFCTFPLVVPAFIYLLRVRGQNDKKYLAFTKTGVLVNNGELHTFAWNNTEVSAGTSEVCFQSGGTQLTVPYANYSLTERSMNQALARFQP